MPVLTVGLAGITGKFGRLLATKLLEDKHITLRGYARDTSKVAPSLGESPRVQLFKGEASDDAAIKTFVSGCDVVVCAYMGTDEIMIDGQKKLIDACDQAGVPRYVASDWTLDYTKLKLGEFSLKDQVIHVKAHLETKRNVQGVHILVGGFMDPMLSSFFRVWDAEAKTLRYWGEGTEPWEATSYANAAEFTAAVIADTSAVGVKKFLGDRKDIQEIAAAFETVYGFKPGMERLGSLDELNAHVRTLQKEDPVDVLSYISSFFEYYLINGKAFVGPETDGEQYPSVKPETWEDFLSKRTLEELPDAYSSLAN